MRDIKPKKLVKNQCHDEFFCQEDCGKHLKPRWIGASRVIFRRGMDCRNSIIKEWTYVVKDQRRKKSRNSEKMWLLILWFKLWNLWSPSPIFLIHFLRFPFKCWSWMLSIKPSPQ
jgi:hypothetical protein